LSATRELFLIDTSVWIRVYRRRPVPVLEERASYLLRREAAVVNQAILTELLIGCKTEEEYGILAEQFLGVYALPIDDSTWGLAARLGFRLARLGIIASVPDLVIAASAVEHEAVLVHADADFDRIAASTELRVESYAQPPI